MRIETSKLDRILVILGVVFLVIFAGLFLLFWGRHLADHNSNAPEYAQIDLDGEEIKQYLFLSSYAPNFETFNDQYTGIKSVMDENGSLVDVFCMNTKKFNRETDQEAFNEYFAKTMSDRDAYDAVIVGDDAALLFAMEHQEELFDQIPIVYFAINNEETARIASENDYICGYIEPHPLQQTINVALELQPAADTIVCIYDNTETGVADGANFFALEEKYPELTFEGFNFGDHTAEETEDFVRSLDLRTILIHLTAYKDVTGKTYSMTESTLLITGASGTPVYRDGVSEIGLGMAGGMELDYCQLGKEAAQAAVEIVGRGILPKELELRPSMPSVYRYDYNVLKSYGLDVSKLPKGSEIIYEPGDGLNRYLNLTGIMLVLSAAIACFWGHSALNRKMAITTAKQLEKNNKELVVLEEEANYKATHDYMTGLLNRHSCLAVLEEALASEKDYTVLLVDIDNLKDINEAYGHEVGDRYLCKVSENLQRYAESRNIILARYGGDEFLIVFIGKVLQDNSPEITEIKNIFQQGISVGNDVVVMLASGGIATSRYSDPAHVVVDADAAVDEAKRSGKNQFVFQNKSLREKTESDNAVRQKIQDAITRDGFEMVYQPQVNAETLEIEGYESLCRLKDNSASPAVFIPIAERYGMIKEIGRITTRLAIEQIAKWRDGGMEIKPVSINFSSYQVADAGYVDFLFELLKKWEISPNYIILEITEGLLLEETEVSRSTFQRLTQRGIRIHLDDFGTGYSSFGYFTYIPIDTIKIDKSLTDNYLGDNDKFVKKLVETIHSMDKKVITEGVEEKWQYEKLREFGCDIIQGYYFSKPLPKEEIPGWTPKLHE